MDGWIVDWAWSLPLMLLNVVVHVFGLAFINDSVITLFKDTGPRRRFMINFAVVMGVSVLLMILLHTVEGAVWALAYWVLGLLPNLKSAMLYSLGAMTGVGAPNLSLAYSWQMMGVLQALTGLLLFGLTTAFMFAMIQSIWARGTDVS